ncbi:MAG TPA: hypothetical protein VNH11_21155 [Pirellulales bacterium]|nr:hypothetical protein [Pirellulales bacterium]
MIDGRGQARITDFGLARLEHGASGVGEIAGTPAYMASRTVGARRDDDPERPLLAGAGPLRSVRRAAYFPRPRKGKALRRAGAQSLLVALCYTRIEMSPVSDG